jgi:hypothetical protein
MHLLIEDHIWVQLLEEAIAKVKEEDYNVLKKEGEYHESNKEQSSCVSNS